VANVRQPVRFSQAVAAAGEQHATFIEVSPHPLLAHAVGETLAGSHHHCIPTLQRDADDTHTFHTNVNAAHTVQAPRTPHPPGPHSVLPATPWHHASHWIAASKATRRSRRGPKSDWAHDLAWPVRPLGDAVEAEAGSWLVFADAALGADIAHAFGEEISVEVVSPTMLADDAVGPTLLDCLGEVTNVLYAPNLSSAEFDAESAHLLFGATRRLTAALSTIASPPRLFVLTPSVSSGDDADPAQAILWGLGRMLALAHPHIWGGILELSDSVLVDTIGASRGEDSAAPVGDISDIWRVCEPDLRRTLLRDHVAVLVAAVMGLPSSNALNRSADFFELGMDSLMSVLLQRALADTLGVLVDQSVIFDYPTVEELAEHLATIGDAGDELAEANLSERVN
jgi:acyl transferase domain-containing protein